MRNLVISLAAALALAACAKEKPAATATASSMPACCAMKDGKMSCADEKGEGKDDMCAKNDMACCKTAAASPTATPAPK